MLPLPNNILTHFGAAAEDALWCTYCSTPDHKDSQVTSTDLICALAMKVEKIAGRESGNLSEAIYEVLKMHSTNCNSHGMQKMAQVINRGGWVHELLSIRQARKKVA